MASHASLVLIEIYLAIKELGLQFFGYIIRKRGANLFMLTLLEKIGVKLIKRAPIAIG